jgi:hypothetical protein
MAGYTSGEVGWLITIRDRFDSYARHIDPMI